MSQIEPSSIRHCIPLGSAAEAEDIVHDVWFRWQAANRYMVLDPPAFLPTTATRLAVNVAQSARSRPETYVGPWLPEPVDTARQSAGVRGLLLLEKLSPAERAAYVLREAFDYPYRQVGDILQPRGSEHSAIGHPSLGIISRGAPRAVSSTEQRCLVEAFIAAAEQGDMLVDNPVQSTIHW
jgi:hypothetical protein